MATLSNPHWEAVPPKTRELLIGLGTMNFEPFYLAGGTALALRLGHRISQDLDLFAAIDDFHDDWRKKLQDQINQRFALKTNQNSPLGLVMSGENMDVSFFRYGYPLLAPTESVEGIEIAGVLDIGLMKLDAIAGRGYKKDFFDAFVISQTNSLDEQFEAGRLKYPYAHGFGMRILRSLIDFRQADPQPDPILLAPIEWDQVKKFFLSEAKRLGKKIFEGT